jgi:hypothetical protein
MAFSLKFSDLGSEHTHVPEDEVRSNVSTLKGKKMLNQFSVTMLFDFVELLISIVAEANFGVTIRIEVLNMRVSFKMSF